MDTIEFVWLCCMGNQFKKHNRRVENGALLQVRQLVLTMSNAHCTDRGDCQQQYCNNNKAVISKNLYGNCYSLFMMKERVINVHLNASCKK